MPLNSAQVSGLAHRLGSIATQLQELCSVLHVLAESCETRHVAKLAHCRNSAVRAHAAATNAWAWAASILPPPPDKDAHHQPAGER